MAKIKFVDNLESPSTLLDVQYWEGDCLTAVVSLQKPVNLSDAGELARQEMEHMLWVGKPGYKP